MPRRDHFLTEKERRKRDSAEADLMLAELRAIRRRQKEKKEEE